MSQNNDNGRANFNSFVNDHQAKWDSRKATRSGTKAAVNPLTWGSPGQKSSTNPTPSPVASQPMSPVNGTPKYKRDHSIGTEHAVNNSTTTSPLASNRSANRTSHVFSDSGENKQVKLDKATADWASQLRSSIYDDKKPKLTSMSTRPMNSSYAQPTASSAAKKHKPRPNTAGDSSTSSHTPLARPKPASSARPNSSRSQHTPSKLQTRTKSNTSNASSIHSNPKRKSNSRNSSAPGSRQHSRPASKQESRNASRNSASRSASERHSSVEPQDMRQTVASPARLDEEEERLNAEIAQLELDTTDPLPPETVEMRDDEASNEKTPTGAESTQEDLTPGNVTPVVETTLAEEDPEVLRAASPEPAADNSLLDSSLGVENASAAGLPTSPNQTLDSAPVDTTESIQVETQVPKASILEDQVSLDGSVESSQADSRLLLKNETLTAESADTTLGNTTPALSTHATDAELVSSAINTDTEPAATPEPMLLPTETLTEADSVKVRMEAERKKRREEAERERLEAEEQERQRKAALDKIREERARKAQEEEKARLEAEEKAKKEAAKPAKNAFMEQQLAEMEARKARIAAMKAARANQADAAAQPSAAKAKLAEIMAKRGLGDGAKRGSISPKAGSPRAESPANGDDTTNGDVSPEHVPVAPSPVENGHAESAEPVSALEPSAVEASAVAANGHVSASEEPTGMTSSAFASLPGQEGAGGGVAASMFMKSMRKSQEAAPQSQSQSASEHAGLIDGAGDNDFRIQLASNNTGYAQVQQNGGEQ